MLDGTTEQVDKELKLSQAQVWTRIKWVKNLSKLYFAKSGKLCHCEGLKTCRVSICSCCGMCVKVYIYMNVCGVLGAGTILLENFFLR